MLFSCLHHGHLVMAVRQTMVSVFLLGKFSLVLQEYFHKNLLETLIMAVTHLLDFNHYCWFSAFFFFQSLFFCGFALFGAIIPPPFFNYSISIYPLWFCLYVFVSFLICLKNFKSHTWLFMLKIGII